MPKSFSLRFYHGFLKLYYFLTRAKEKEFPIDFFTAVAEKMITKLDEKENERQCRNVRKECEEVMNIQERWTA
ncbi:hypothetical protein Nepgr_012749 [Nepenthes gracilis]|uniref:Uncharacterized protein n=1 Tax=Nepenthes gracilis TaxID=150966 RepID=A0AAD3SGP4_NEPGR|nr:hypothetical protein Nepgr_012749 [Nepenthes gracilis]